MTDFVIADLHLGDEATCRGGGRPFSSADHMGREIMRRWNDIVRPDDTVFVLGDIGRARHIEAVRDLNGRKHLVAGNGDDLLTVASSRIFASVSVARWLPGFLLTHIPVHPSQLRRRTINVHGHLHRADLDDPRYRCVSVEQTGFAPMRLDALGKGAVQARLF